MDMLDQLAAHLPAKTGKTLQEWIIIATPYKGMKHKEAMEILKKEYSLGMNYADLIIHKVNGTDSGSMDADTLITAQYKGKENLKPIYDMLMSHIMKFGDDIEIAPKKAYVSLRRRKQFACLKPATKTRFELELIIKGQEPTGILEAIPAAGAMCTHKIKLESEAAITEEVITWIKKAYQCAN